VFTVQPVEGSVFEDDSTADYTPSASGILHCLRMLAAEAALLRLDRTLDVLFLAIETCAEEHGPLPAVM
jgi:hypothetical protein